MTEPALVISSPEEGSTILGDRVTIDFTVGEVVLTNYQRVPEKKDGQGHVHFWLDSPVARQDSAVMYFQTEPFTFEHVPPGKHTLIVEVVNNDHSSFDPPVVSLVTFKSVLPTTVKLQALATPSPTRPFTEQKYATNTIVPLFIALIFINIGCLWWLWSWKRSH